MSGRTLMRFTKSSLGMLPASLPTGWYKNKSSKENFVLPFFFSWLAVNRWDDLAHEYALPLQRFYVAHPCVLCKFHNDDLLKHSRNVSGRVAYAAHGEEWHMQIQKLVSFHPLYSLSQPFGPEMFEERCPKFRTAYLRDPS